MNIQPNPDLKPLSPLGLYNFTQDNRHLVIIDTRPLSTYLSGFIRKSYWLDIQLQDKLTQLHSLFEYINKQDSNSIENEKKYKLQKLRRLVVIVDEQYTKLPDVDIYLSQLDIYSSFNRHYVLLNNFDTFRLKYSFLVLSLNIDSIEGTADFEVYQQELLKTHQNEVIYANSAFPFELDVDRLYMGTNFNKHNQRQMKDLSIDKTVEISLDEEKHNLVDIQQNEAHVYINRDKLIDFDNIFTILNDFIGSSKVLFCANDLRLVSTFCIAFMMWAKKLSVNMASLKVFNIMGNTDADRIVYNQVMNFVPGAIKIINV